MITKKYIPQIRFKGFDEDWSNLQFFETLDSIIDFRGRTPKKIGLKWSKKGYVALSALNVKNGYIDFSLDNHFGDEELYQKWMGGKELVAGQVLFTTEAPMGNVAQVPDNQGYILSQRTIAFNVKSSVIKNDFLAVLLRSPATFNRLESMTSGGTAKGVSQKSMAKLEVDIPSNLQEQTVIGNLFQNIDQTISLQRRKYEQTQTLKRSLLSKMFPKAGQTQPEIRLQGFGGDWIEMELGDIGYTYTGLSGKTKADFSHGQAMYITYMNVYSNAIASTSMLEAVDKDDSQNLVKKGDVLFTTSSETPEEVGMSSVWQHDLHLVYLNSFCFGFRLKEKVDSNYLAFMLRSNKVRADISLLAQGISRYNISKRAMMKIKVPLPSIKEQAAIGEFFEQVDETIVLQAKQLKILENIKESLLAKMFV
ncbi:hypothetical protein AK822_13470 [Psychrobacter sp. P11F6]|uniref:restriction endonuclease subunit S n=1 Tax=Psychrobacter sp. P11F6 TaxID=1699621 RepID=UPI000713FFDE|nr:restriction endonuclease subunit S [Psychrobacter sp. P11F6]KRG32534.1 hypothetical protein AK822_13470 [Psychrobacter sp. P11F6]